MKTSIKENTSFKHAFNWNFKKYFLFYHILIFLILFLLNVKKISTKLIGVIQVNRHGARTGDGFEELCSKLFFGTKSKQLTINGISQQELLGHYIAEKYMHNSDDELSVLSKEFNENEFIIFSSAVQRAIFSGFGFIKGIYPISKFKLKFIGKENANSTLPIIKNYSNLASSDLLTNISLPINDYIPKRKIPDISLNILDGDTDTIFRIKNCKIKIGENQNQTFYSNLTLKELIILDNISYNYTQPLNFTEEEIKNAVKEIKEKFPIAFIRGLLSKKEKSKINHLDKLKILDKNEKNQLEDENCFSKIEAPHILEFHISHNKKFLKKVNGFLRFAQFHFGNNFIILSPATQLTLNKIQVNKSYNLLLSPSKFQKLLNSRIFDEFKNFLLEFLKNHLQNKEKRLKYVVYSGHDGNILGIIANFFDRKFLIKQMLDLYPNYNFVQPDLASHFLIELHINKENDNFLALKNSELFVKLNYNGKYLTEGLNKDYFVYNKKYEGFDFKNFVKFLESQIDFQYKSMNCKNAEEDDF